MQQLLIFECKYVEYFQTFHIVTGKVVLSIVARAGGAVTQYDQVFLLRLVKLGRFTSDTGEWWCM